MIRSPFRSYLSPLSLLLGWLAILSPEGSRDSTFQLRSGQEIRGWQRGAENSREGRHTMKPLPKKGFWTPPPPMIRSPPPRFVHTLPFSLRRNGRRAQIRRIPPSEASKTGFWRASSRVCFPPKKSHDASPHPPSAVSQRKLHKHKLHGRSSMFPECPVSICRTFNILLCFEMKML